MSTSKGKQDWDIDPDGVRGVVLNVGVDVRSFQDDVKSFGDHVAEAARSAGSLGAGKDIPELGLVGAALALFAQAATKKIAYIGARTGKSVNGAAQATQEYLDGDLRMAANAQRKALKAPEVHVKGKPKPKGEAGKGEPHR
ncbi:DUF6507 family protein [Streptomyces sp. NA02950]|uniref:DUF6507 family protein n=1 Tax=Streptomyces sp. NA02950 TaxID=2742137 RepID=UPI0020CADA23|nr:DUF6507 family protein [Streptomyces sp. NA02950]